MRPNQEFKNLLNNTNFSLALQQGSVIRYDASVGTDWSQDYSTGIYTQTLTSGGGSVNYTGTQNGLNYMNATLPGSPPSNLFWGVPTGTVPTMTDSYTVMVVSNGGSGFDWRHESTRPTAGVFGTGLGLLKVHVTGTTFRYAADGNPGLGSDTPNGGKTKQAYNANSTPYSPSGWYISVYKVEYSGDIFGLATTYATTNGRGDSGGQFYVAGSFAYETSSYPTGQVAINLLQTTNLSAGQSAERGEIIMWGKALTQYQIDYMEGYLKTKWGITY
jgi:hypothetical protein